MEAELPDVQCRSRRCSPIWCCSWPDPPYRCRAGQSSPVKITMWPSAEWQLLEIQWTGLDCTGAALKRHRVQFELRRDPIGYSTADSSKQLHRCSTEPGLKRHWHGTECSWMKKRPNWSLDPALRDCIRLGLHPWKTRFLYQHSNTRLHSTAFINYKINSIWWLSVANAPKWTRSIKNKSISNELNSK